MDKKVHKYRKIDEHNFNAIKTLINTGLSGRENPASHEYQPNHILAY